MLQPIHCCSTNVAVSCFKQIAQTRTILPFSSLISNLLSLNRLNILLQYEISATAEFGLASAYIFINVEKQPKWPRIVPSKIQG
mmetsp:Transcript_43446/g.49084  ORF Transcript_43446/g.49084 Transcript_43446/m.49084 type:complete len:84 (-) Transcript_43446:265-516(-)